MSLLVVGSVALDEVETPNGSAGSALGGSAAYFAYAASYFAPVRLVGVVGDDFPAEFHDFLANRENVDTLGLKRVPGKTFRWKGRYSKDMNSRETLEVQLNVFGEFDPDIPESYRDAKYVFLANGSPQVQRKVLHQVRRPRLVVADTMDLWIETQRPALLELLAQIDGVVLNDQEALLLTGEDFVVNAGLKILALGPKFAIVKKGEHGAMFFSDAGIFAMPAYPTTELVDPTGAGDCFAGGLMGYIAQSETTDANGFKRAMAYGTVTASFTVEDFSLERFKRTSSTEIQSRYERYREMLRLE